MKNEEIKKDELLEFPIKKSLFENVIKFLQETNLMIIKDNEVEKFEKEIYIQFKQANSKFLNKDWKIIENVFTKTKLGKNEDVEDKYAFIKTNIFHIVIDNRDYAFLINYFKIKDNDTESIVLISLYTNINNSIWCLFRGEDKLKIN